MLYINYQGKRPIYEQIVSRVEELIAAGYFSPGTQLPSVRQLACDLSINPNTIQRAYAELERRGMICSVKGRGTFISENSEQLTAGRRKALEEEFDREVRKLLTFGFTKEQLFNRITLQREEEIR